MKSFVSTTLVMIGLFGGLVLYDDLTGQTPPEEKPGLIGYGMIILGMTAFSALVHFLGALCGPGDGIESSGGGDSGDGGGDGGD